MRILISSLLVLSSIAAFAQDKFEQRDANQAERIQQGVQNDSLTKHEAKRLERQEKHVESQEERMKARDGGGELTQKQEAKLNREQNRESRRIFRKKHNARNAK